MSILECFIAVQTSSGQTLSSNSPGASYFLIGLLAVVMGLVAWIFIRANARRSSKRSG